MDLRIRPQSKKESVAINNDEARLVQQEPPVDAGFECDCTMFGVGLGTHTVVGDAAKLVHMEWKAMKVASRIRNVKGRVETADDALNIGLEPITEALSDVKCEKSTSNLPGEGKDKRERIIDGPRFKRQRKRFKRHDITPSPPPEPKRVRFLLPDETENQPSTDNTESGSNDAESSKDHISDSDIGEDAGELELLPQSLEQVSSGKISNPGKAEFLPMRTVCTNLLCCDVS